MTREERQLREAIIAKCRWMNASSLNQGTSGNISARYGEEMLITPSAVPCDAMKPEMIASMPLEGEYGAWEGPLKPSTERRFHLDIMRARSDGVPALRRDYLAFPDAKRGKCLSKASLEAVFRGGSALRIP